MLQAAFEHHMGALRCRPEAARVVRRTAMGSGRTHREPLQQSQLIHVAERGRDRLAIAAHVEDLGQQALR